MTEATIHVGHNFNEGQSKTSVAEDILAIISSGADQKTIQKALKVYSKLVELPPIENVNFSNLVVHSGRPVPGDDDD